MAELRHLPDPAATDALGAELANLLEAGDLVVLDGDLGAGKTALARAVIRALAEDADLDVPSPTFALVHQYGNGSRALYHFDMYRVETFDDLYSTGFFDYLDYGGILAIEWSENIRDVLPDNCKTVTIEKIDENTRKITY